MELAQIALLLGAAALFIAFVALALGCELLRQVRCLAQQLERPQPQPPPEPLATGPVLPRLAESRRADESPAAAAREPEPTPEPEPEPELEPELEPEPETPAVVAAAGEPVVPDAPKEEPEAEAAEPAALLTLLAADSDLPETRYLVGGLKALLDLPNKIIGAIPQGEAAQLVPACATELDIALYERFDEVLLARALPASEARDLAELASWLRERQATEIERLSQFGLKRIATSIGSPFEPGRVDPDPSDGPKPTNRRELDQRVAGVKPGRGGYEFEGQTLCPTRAQRYAYRSE